MSELTEVAKRIIRESIWCYSGEVKELSAGWFITSDSGLMGELLAAIELEEAD